jgi:hypothetical protein
VGSGRGAGEWWTSEPVGGSSKRRRRHNGPWWACKQKTGSEEGDDRGKEEVDWASWGCRIKIETCIQGGCRLQSKELKKVWSCAPCEVEWPTMRAEEEEDRERVAELSR